MNEIQIIVKNFLREAKEEIIREIRKTKRSLQYDMNNKFSSLTNNLIVNLGWKKTNTVNTLDETVLGIALPAEDLTAFENLIVEIDTNTAKRDLIVKIFYILFYKVIRSRVAFKKLYIYFYFYYF